MLTIKTYLVTGELTGANVVRTIEAERVVVPITKGRQIKEKRRTRVPCSIPEDNPTIRRLLQCAEMMVELTKEITKPR